MTRPLCTVVLFLIASCGGGGGGSSSSAVPRFAATDLTIAAATGSGELEIALLGDPPLPVLAQVDLVFDAGSLVFAHPLPIAGLSDLDGHLVAPGRFRLVLGDASSRVGAPLPTGKLARIPFALGPLVSPGRVLVVTFDGSVGAAAAGALSDTESAPGVVRITVQ